MRKSKMERPKKNVYGLSFEEKTGEWNAAGSTLVISPHRDVTALEAIPNALEAFSDTRKFYIREIVKIDDCASRFRDKGMKKIAKYSKVNLTNSPIKI